MIVTDEYNEQMTYIRKQTEHFNSANGSERVRGLYKLLCVCESSEPSEVCENIRRLKLQGGESLETGSVFFSEAEFVFV